MASHGKKIVQISMEVAENTKLGNSNKEDIDQMKREIDQLISAKQQERTTAKTQMNGDQTAQSRESVQGSTGNADTLQGEIFTSIVTLAL